jgi:hypothetical protein
MIQIPFSINKPLLFIALLLAVSCQQPETASPTPIEMSIPKETNVVPTMTVMPRDTATPVPIASPTPLPAIVNEFDGEAALDHLAAQLAFGPRWPGSAGHLQVGDYIVDELEMAGWAVEEQIFDYRSVLGRNIIGKANEGAGPVIILGAHYDTRRVADQTPGAVEDQIPVPGAVDGASGVAVLLELARSLDLAQIPHEIWLAFFDLEDNGSGGLPGWDWIVGSTYMAENLTITPEAVVVVDMIGDSDQQLFYDGNSDPELRAQLWQIAADLGYGDFFIPEVKYTMIDDHLPFAQKGITAVDIIDFDYPYWHTVEDTLDKASPDSLTRVGRTVETWLETK